MRRRRLLLLLTLILVVSSGIVLLFPWPRYALWGLVRGEASYQGWPTSYWSNVIRASSVDRPWALERAVRFLGLNRPPGAGYALLLKGDPQSLGVLRALLRDEDGRVRDLACDGIRKIAFRTRELGTAVDELRQTVPDLVVLAQGDGLEKTGALLALGYIGPDAADAVPLLKEGLKDEKVLNRVRVAMAICMVDPQEAEGCAVLLAGLKSSDFILRSNAVDALQLCLDVHGKSGAEILRRKEPELPAVLLEALKQETNRGGPSKEYAGRIRELLQQIAPDAEGKEDLKPGP
jgi:hypothetical protein